MQSALESNTHLRIMCALFFATIMLGSPVAGVVAFGGVGTAAAVDDDPDDTDPTESAEFFEVPVNDESVTVWERSALPLRADTGNADTALDNSRITVSPVDGPEATNIREELAVYPEGEITVELSERSGAEVDQFAGEDAEIITMYLDDEAEVDDNLDLLPSSADELEEVVDADATFALETDEFDNDGELTHTLDTDDFDPGPGQYGVIITEGSVFDVDDGDLSVADADDNTGAIVGMETISVHEQPSSIATPDSVEPGDDIEFDVETDLDGEVNHVVAVYDESTFTDSITTFNITEEIDADLSSEDVIIEHDIETVRGSSEVANDVNMLGVTLSERNAVATLELQDLIAFAANQTDVEEPETVATDDLVLNASVKALQGGADEEIVVETFEDFPEGEYRFVHMAAESDSTQSFETSDGFVTLADQPNFEITELDLDDDEINATAGVDEEEELLEANITVENTGGAEGDQTLETSLNGDLDDIETIDETELTLDPGEEETVSVTYEAGDDLVGERELIAATDDDEKRADIRIRSLDEFFEVEITDITTPVVATDNVTVNAIIENTGLNEGNQTISFDVTNDIDDTIATKEVGLDPEEKTNLTFEYTTTIDDRPEITATVASADDSAEASVFVREARVVIDEDRRFDTITDALDDVAPNETIEIRRSGTYHEDVTIDVEGVTLTSTVGTDAEIDGSVTIDNHSVTLANLAVTANDSDQAIAVDGYDTEIRDSEIDGDGDDGIVVEDGVVGVAGNTIEGSATGIAFEAASNATASAVHDNNIVDNDAGIDVDEDAGNLTATFNWWDSSTGPSGEGPGQGVSVSENVMFTPWFDRPFDRDPGVRSAAAIFEDEELQDHFGSVAEAFDAVASEQTVGLYPGTYDESLTVDTDSVTVTSIDDAEETTINGTITVEADDVVLEELTFQGESDPLIEVTDGTTGFELLHSTVEATTTNDGVVANSPVVVYDTVFDTDDGATALALENGANDSDVGAIEITGYEDGIVVDSVTDVGIFASELEDNDRGIVFSGDDVTHANHAVHETELRNNDIGIEFDDENGLAVDNETINITDNNIVGNEDYGIDASGLDDPINAWLNWWGSPEGPFGDGDDITGEENLNVEPWYDDAVPGGESVLIDLDVIADSTYGSENVSVEWELEDGYLVDELVYVLENVTDESDPTEIESDPIESDPAEIDPTDADELEFDQLDDGDYTITVAANDSDDEILAADNETFLVNADAPELNLERIQRTGSQAVPINVSVEAVDPDGASIDAVIEDDAGNEVFTETLSDGWDDVFTDNIVWDTSGADEDGEYTLTVTATDAEGNIANSTRTVEVDNTPPEIVDIDPDDGDEVFDNESVEVEVIVRDDASDVERVNLTASAEFTSYTEEYSTTDIVDRTATITVDQDDLVGDGEYSIVDVTATDELGNEIPDDEAEDGGTITFDSTEPELRVSGSNFRAPNATVTVVTGEPVQDVPELTADTPHGEGLTRANDEIELRNQFAEGDGQAFVYRIEAGERGDYDVTVTATDLAGNPATESISRNITGYVTDQDGQAQIAPGGLQTGIGADTRLPNEERVASVAESASVPERVNPVVNVTEADFVGQVLEIDLDLDEDELRESEVTFPVADVTDNLPGGITRDDVELNATDVDLVRVNETTGELEPTDTEIIDDNGDVLTDEDFDELEDGTFRAQDIDQDGLFLLNVRDDVSPEFTAVRGDVDLDEDEDSTVLTFEYDDLELSEINLSAVRGFANSPDPDEQQVTGDSAQLEVSDLDPGEEREVGITIEDQAGNPQTESVTVSRAEDDDDDDDTTPSIGGGGPRAVAPSIDITPGEVDPETGLIGPTTVDIRNLGAGETTAIDFRETRAALEVPDGDLDLDRIGITAADSMRTASLSVQSGPDPVTEDSREFDSPRGSPMGYVQIDHELDEDNVEAVEIDFRVSKERLGDEDPREVALYRLEGESAEAAGTPADPEDWRELPTDVVDETDTHFVFTAESPGLSEFAAAVKQPQFEIDDALIDVQEVTTGDSVQVEVLITNIGGAEGTFTAELWVDDEMVEQEDLTIAADATRQTLFDREFTEEGTYEVRVNDVSLGEVRVDPLDDPEDPEPDPDPEDPDDPVSTMLLVAVLGVVIALIAVGVFVYQRRFADE